MCRRGADRGSDRAVLPDPWAGALASPFRDRSWARRMVPRLRPSNLASAIPTWRAGRRGAPRRRIADGGTHFCSTNIRFRPLRKDRAGMLLVRASVIRGFVRTVIEGDT
jgi:hypothetical protein